MIDEKLKLLNDDYAVERKSTLKKVFVKVLKEEDARGYVICNSPNLEKDAKLLKDYYLAL